MRLPQLVAVVSMLLIPVSTYAQALSDGEPSFALLLPSYVLTTRLVDTTRGSFRRFTFGPAVEGQGVLTRFQPISLRVRPKATLWDVYEQRTDGTGGETVLRANPENEYPIDWSPDGRYLLFVRQDVKTDQDVLALPLFGDRKPLPVAETQFYESEAKFSPDGRWIAFSSNETGGPTLTAVKTVSN